MGVQVERALAERGEARGGGEGGGQPFGLVGGGAGGDAGENAGKLYEMKEEIDVSRCMRAGWIFVCVILWVVQSIDVPSSKARVPTLGRRTSTTVAGPAVRSLLVAKTR